MDDDVLSYYERELTFIREMGVEFAKKYPKVAGRLLMEPDKCEDPHTERLIEAFALLAGRIHKKIDDGFPEITEALLQIIYPHYLSPIPSMSVVRFEAVRTVPPSGYTIEKGTPLYSKPVGGVPCQFSTCYPATLWPIEVVSAGLRDPKRLVANAQQAIVISLMTSNNVSLSQLNFESLRFFLNGPGQHVFHLYELLFTRVCHVEAAWQDGQGRSHGIALPPECIAPVGFDRDEAIIPYPRRSFPGYVLLFEYFAFPEKFLFFDLRGLGRLRSSPLPEALELWIYLDRAVQSNVLVSQDTFCLNATPAVNLFSTVAEPISVEHRKADYHVIPDLRRSEATEVFSIDRVSAASVVQPGQGVIFEPFYSLRHRLVDDEGGERPFWHAERRPSGKKGDDGTEIFLSFTDGSFQPTEPDVETVTVHVTCTNRDLPARVPFLGPDGDFDMEVAAPVSRITCFIKPTPTRRPALGGPLQWRLISHLALNYVSLVQGGVDELKEILRLYDFDDSPATRQQISGIVSLRSDYVTKRIGQSFCRGIQVTVEFDEDKYVGAGVFLFSCVLERFLGQYVSVNSFSQMVAKTIQRKEVLKKWPPRSGKRVLL